MEPRNTTNSNRNLRRTYIAMVERICEEPNQPMRYKGTLESMLYEFFSQTSRSKYLWKRETFRRLLVHLYEQRCYALLRTYASVRVLHNISCFGDRLVRPVEDWESELGSERDQLRSLMRHCFAQYETPRFMETAFLRTQKLYMLWYVQMGKGRSVKQLSRLPIAFTSKMAHHFRNAPDYVSVPQALRYAQAMGYGATVQTARSLAFSRLAIVDNDQEVFWSTVIQFFARQNELQVNELNNVLDYVAHRFREDNGFSMRNRTLNALLRQSQAWHRQTYINHNGRFVRWDSSGIQPLYVEEFDNDTKVVYRTVELLDSVALFEEGYAMQHCVAEYDLDCRDGRSSIFSLQREMEGEPVKRLATLEVELPTFQLVQAQAKCNTPLDTKARELVDLWITRSLVVPAQRARHPVPNGQAVAVRRIHRPREQDIESELFVIVKVIFWLLYLLWRFVWVH
ncbi:MAG: PcfJ domain-containing protein [Bacteroidota bacterium]